MTQEFNISQSQRDLMFKVIDLKNNLKNTNLSQEKSLSVSAELEFYEKLREGFYEIIPFTSSDVYQHTDDFNDNSDTNQFFKNFIEVSEDVNNRVQAAVENYFNQIIFRSPELDWVFIDAAIYSMYRCFHNTSNLNLIKNIDPISYRILSKNSDYIEIQTWGWLATKVLIWITWIVGIIFLFSIADNSSEFILPCALTLYKSYHIFKDRRHIKNHDSIVKTKLELISKAYSGLNKINYNKKLVANDLYNCRNNDITIPNYLFDALS